ncbi:hypothetical protein CGCSCA5_v008260 [Colletotrichum siamense]|nr:hypothetical protein CGCSCA5_v008260 [Colletotrichum siamense]
MVTPPTAQQWEQHRSVIVDMYSRRPLKAVRAHMRETYGFLATDRMFKGRFKTWGVEKNRRHRRDAGDGGPDSREQSPAGPSQQAPLPNGLDIPSHDSIIPRRLPPDPARAITPPEESPITNDAASEYSETLSPRPQPWPLTPATTVGDLSPTGSQDGENLTTPQTCQEIVRLASEILATLVAERRDRPAPDDHVDIYQSLHSKLRFESQLRSSLVNRQLKVGECKTVAGKTVEEMITSFHATVPIGVLSTLNQITNWTTIQELVTLLLETSQTNPGTHHDFAQLIRKLRHLVYITNHEEFQSSMEQICYRLEDRVEETLGSISLVGFYLILLLNARKAKSIHKTDNKIRRKSLEITRHVTLHHEDQPKVVLDFHRYVIAYLSIVAPGEKDVLDMAEVFYKRAQEYFDLNEHVEGSHAKLYYGSSCAYLADCRYVRNNTEDRHQARSLLFQSIWCYANAPWANRANAERQMKKLREWCEEANDMERLGMLRGIEDMMEEEARQRGGPLIPRAAAT